jgi:hypothetical protein
VGFRPQEKTFRVVFHEEHDLHGLEIRTRSVPIGTILSVMRAAGASMRGGKPGIEDIESVSALFDEFGGALIEWNLDHPKSGEPVEATPEGLRTLPFDLVTTLAMEWVGAVVGAAAPLGPSSSPGPGPRMDSLPMEPLSSSRAS